MVRAAIVFIAELSRLLATATLVLASDTSLLIVFSSEDIKLKIYVASCQWKRDN